MLGRCIDTFELPINEVLFHVPFTLTHASSSGVYRNQEKGGHAKGGRHLARGGMSKYFFGMRWWQPLPVENHFLHNEVAQIGIEGEINTEAVCPIRCRFWRHDCQSHDRWVSNIHGNPVNAGHANISLHAHFHSRKSTERRLRYQVSLKEVDMQQKIRKPGARQDPHCTKYRVFERNC